MQHQGLETSDVSDPQWITCPEVLEILHRSGAVRVGDFLMHEYRGECQVSEVFEGAMLYEVIQLHDGAWGRKGVAYPQQEVQILWEYVKGWRRPT